MIPASLRLTAKTVIIRALVSGPETDAERRVYVDGIRSIGADVLSEEILTLIGEHFPRELTDELLCLLAPQHTRHLRLTNCKSVTCEGLCKAIVKCCHHLQVMDFRDCTHLLHPLVFYCIKENVTNLYSVNLEDCEVVTDDIVQVLLMCCPHLKHINLSCCKSITDKAFAINNGYRDTRDVDIAHCPPGISQHAFLAGKNLTSVDLSGCQSLTSNAIRNLVDLCGPSLMSVNVAWTGVGCVALLHLVGLDAGAVDRFVREVDPECARLLERLKDNETMSACQADPNVKQEACENSSETPSNISIATVGKVPTLVDIIKTQCPERYPDSGIIFSQKEITGVDTRHNSATPAVGIEPSGPNWGKENCLDIIPSEDEKSEDLEDACSNLLEKISSEDYGNENSSCAFHSAVRDLTSALNELNPCSKSDSYSHEEDSDADDSTVSNSVYDEGIHSGITASSVGGETTCTAEKADNLDAPPQYELHARNNCYSQAHLSTILKKDELESSAGNYGLDEHSIPNVNCDHHSSDDQGPIECRPPCYDDTSLEPDNSQLVLENHALQATSPFHETTSTAKIINDIHLNEKEPVCPNTPETANGTGDSEGLTASVPCCSQQGTHVFALNLNEINLLPSTGSVKDSLEESDSRNLLLEDSTAAVELRSSLTLELSKDDSLMVSEAEFYSPQANSTGSTSTSTETNVCTTHTVEASSSSCVRDSEGEKDSGQFKQIISYSMQKPLQGDGQTCDDSVCYNQRENDLSVKTESVESVEFGSSLAGIGSEDSSLKEKTVGNIAIQLVDESPPFKDIPDPNDFVHQQDSLPGTVTKECYLRKDSCNVSDNENSYGILLSNEIPRPSHVSDVSSQSSNWERQEDLENKPSNTLECIPSCSRDNASEAILSQAEKHATDKKKDIDNLEISIEEKALATQVYTPKITSLDVSSFYFHSKALGAACLKLFSKANPHLREFSTTWSQLDDDTLIYMLKNEPELQELCLVDCESLSNLSLISMATFCPKLTTVNLKGTCFLTDHGIKPLGNLAQLSSLCLAESLVTDCALDSLAQRCGTQLVNLDLCWCEDVTDVGMSAITSSCPNLSHLGFRQCAAANNTFTHLANNCRFIKSLNVAGVDRLSDAMVTTLARNLACLMEVDLSWNSSLSDNGIGELLLHCSKLEDAVLSGLKFITSKPFLPIIGRLASWRLKQELCGFRKRKNERERIPSVTFLRPCDTETAKGLGEDLPYRSISYAPSLRRLTLEYSDKVNDDHLAQIVAVCRGTLYIRDYYTQPVEPKWLFL